MFGRHATCKTARSVPVCIWVTIWPLGQIALVLLNSRVFISIHCRTGWDEAFSIRKHIAIFVRKRLTQLNGEWLDKYAEWEQQAPHNGMEYSMC